jgi:peptidoglycan/xylan/chitin deacetylase (PgdA/CDA1 family)
MMCEAVASSAQNRHERDGTVMAAAIRWPFTAARVARNLLSNLLDPPVLVLTYHRVARLQTDPQMLAVSPEHFRAQLQFLRKQFPLVRFEEDWSSSRKPAVAITFDDGYADNAVVALPILEELEIPATFFVSTGAIGTLQEFWSDELERIVMGEWVFPESFELHDGRLKAQWPTGTPGERQVCYREMLAAMKEVDAVTRDSWLRRLRQWARAGEEGRETSRAMTVEELRLLGKSAFATVGAHSVTHTPLSSLPIAEQRKEIQDSKKQLESWLGREVTLFSYPFGQRCDYTQESVALCREAGFIKAAANFPGQAHRWTDPYQIPRLVVRDWPLDMFMTHLRRFWIV